MSATTQHGTRQTTIEADPAMPTIRITREFDAPVEHLFRAHVEADLFKQWIGPRAHDMGIESFDCRTGGSYRYGTDEHRFYGSFHEVRPDQRIVQTFTYEGEPDGVALETGTFENLGDGRSRLTWLSVCDSMEGRDGIIVSGMESGVVEGYEQLDELLAGLS